MFKPLHFAIALAVAGFTVPAFAGPWQSVATYHGSLFRTTAEAPHPATEATSGTFATEKPAAPRVASKADRAFDGFTYAGEGTGWEPAQHKYVFTANGLAHSNDCDHRIRVVQGPTPSEVESTRTMSPGS